MSLGNRVRNFASSRRVPVRNYTRDLLINRVIGSALLPKSLRWRALRATGMPIQRCIIPPGVFFGSPRVRIGIGTQVGYGCFFDALEWITIGDRCDLAMNVLLVTSSHHVGPRRRRAGASVRHPIVIEDGAWIGARVVILPGVTVGAGAVIAAGSVVTTDCAPDSLYAGVPAQLKGPVREEQVPS
jgi:maltose O-acetyltransferase